MQATMEYSSGHVSAGWNVEKALEKVKEVAGGSAVVVFGTTDCCMCHVAKHLLLGLGVAPTVIDLEERNAAEVSFVLSRLCSASSTSAMQPLPAVFVGGRLLGGIDSLMASHINGSLVPLLKQAGALWL